VVNRFIGLDTKTADAVAMVESYCDVLSTWVKQKRLGQTAQTADWEIGTGVGKWLDGGSPDDRRALRSMKTGAQLFPEPGPAPRYKGSKNGESLEPHELSGILNRAFYEVAMKVGTEAAMGIWYDALKDLDTSSTLPAMAAATRNAAAKRLGASGGTVAADAWRAAGVL